MLLAGGGSARPLCWAGGRQVAPACISKPSVPLVTLIINDEFVADFQLRGIALPVVRSVLVCVSDFRSRHLPNELAACNAFALLTIGNVST